MSRCEQQMPHERQQEMREAENLNRCLVQNISTISAGYGLLTLFGQPIRNRALVTLVVDSPCCYC
jgi:hypothetical protein